MLIESPWIVTLGSLVILDRDDATDGEIVPPTFQPEYQTVKLLRANFVDAIPRKLVSNELSFRRVKTLASYTEACLFALAHAAALPKTPEDCTVQGRFGDVWKLVRARVMMRSPEIDGRTYRASYTLTGMGFGLIVAPTIPIPGFPLTVDSTLVTADSTERTADDEGPH